MPTLEEYRKKFEAGDVEGISDSDLALLIPDFFSVPLAENGSIVWQGEADHERARQVMRLGLLPIAQRELIAAMEEFAQKVLTDRSKLTNEDFFKLADAHSRFWFAQKAYSHLANLIFGHLANLGA